MEKDENGIETETYQENIILAVWRVDSDGNRTCLGEGIANDGVSAVFDPHPTFGEPKYRIVATDTQTGFIGYEDEISELDINSIVLQWDEEWTQLEADPEEGLYDWSGNLVELPYNIAISEDSNPDVALMEYAGRSHPVSYYGTQLGVTGNWSTDISKESDKQKLDLLRKLAVWTDDVYVREPTGVGYWANVQTSLNQSYDSAAVSVSLSITRVDRTDGITNGN